MLWSNCFALALVAGNILLLFTNSGLLGVGIAVPVTSAIFVSITSLVYVVLTSTATSVSDKTAPTITFTHEGDGNLNVLATDESGVSSVCINKSTSISDCYWNRYVDNFKYEITNTTQETYYAHVRDIYGNVSVSSVAGFR